MLQMDLIPEQIVSHYRDVATMLTNLGCGPKTRSALTHKSGQTLKQYGTTHTSAQHRLVPAEDLQVLRDEATRLHWELVDRPISRWFSIEGYGVAKAIRPERYTAFGADQLSRGTHTFLPRVIELSENNGGYVHHRNNELFPMEEAMARVGSPRFEERSRWRRARFRLRAAGREHVVTEIAHAHGYGPHSIGQIASEYEQWRVGIKPAALDALEEAAR
ncbi:hypothetical protein [Rhizobium leguminosarum]|uniref:hypothetical protein n=1 Tax=Rhizobium leguminosarum TaxID=384 RepID=UPI0014425F15|nr:hypothetical protein [Rhizobium leguminosarum]NKL63281.1 hypothetical protein [Rhizobium leguminosarum bv. viciae]